MERKNQNGKQYLRSISIIFYAIMSGMTLFMIAVLFITTTPEQMERLENPPVYYAIIGVLFLIAVFIKLFWKPRRLETIKNMESIKEKLNNYRSLLIVQWAIAEFISLFSSMFYLLTHQLFFIGVTIGVIASYLLLRPSKDRLINELTLSDAEVFLLEDQEAVVADVKNTR
ncbi:hypothetical protein [Solitalea canadensis]|uniref:Uncharacterized protein n=1 Tax=Solitalea canadensis (strain ATCC 29591 / DSM 3403 / JCM 21819 / LMG 8368 / NBRC 15130 / NCIMB 12057 / USAM 9D) TaxID=929556 RepID=H8KL88_SOLCM|nr:hypothetical protein [Solitalea canadensis]AFD09171.1 hypothetical protein Solca_4181 [Solitalea canadensis DSM 3403]